MDSSYSNGRGQSFDYSADNGYGRAQTQRRGFRGTEENAKTKLCMRWLAGDCRFGPRCNFAHGQHELRRMPPKPGRFSHDTREREMDKEGHLTAYPPYGYGSVSFDGGYARPFGGGHSNICSENYPGNLFIRNPVTGSTGVVTAGGGNHGIASGGAGGGGGSGSYSGHTLGPSPSTNGGYNGNGGIGVGPAPPGAMVQPSGPIHIPAATTRGGSSDFYTDSGGVYPQEGPNGWTMYKDPKSGEPYYHNHVSGITQWKCPDEWPMH